MASAGDLTENHSFATMGAREQGRKKTYYRGKIVGMGGDDEPLMTDIKKISQKEYKDYLDSTKGKEDTLILSKYESDISERLKNRGYNIFDLEGKKKITDEKIGKYKSQLASIWNEAQGEK